MNYNDHDNLFVGSGNTLQWPNTTNPLRGFRAYFTVPTGGSMSVRRGTPARVVLYEPVPTATEENTVNPSARKVMRNGMLYIIRDGKRYNVFGQNIFPME